MEKVINHKVQGILTVAWAYTGYTDAVIGRIRAALRSSLRGRSSEMVTAQGEKGE